MKGLQNPMAQRFSHTASLILVLCVNVIEQGRMA